MSEELTPEEVTKLAKEFNMEEWEIQLRMNCQRFYRDNIDWFNLDRYVGMDIAAQLSNFVVNNVKEYGKNVSS